MSLQNYNAFILSNLFLVVNLSTTNFTRWPQLNLAVHNLFFPTYFRDNITYHEIGLLRPVLERRPDYSTLNNIQWFHITRYKLNTDRLNLLGGAGAGDSVDSSSDASGGLQIASSDTSGEPDNVQEEEEEEEVLKKNYRTFWTGNGGSLVCSEFEFPVRQTSREREVSSRDCVIVFYTIYYPLLSVYLF
jgi:hypothetical protein